MTITYLAIPGIREEHRVAHTMETISRLVTYEMGIQYGDLFTKSREASTVVARQICMLLIRKHTPESLTTIGRYFNRDHTTVIHGLRVIEDRIRLEEVIKTLFTNVENALRK